jgi:polyhydroxybutyrate depolymerase
MMKRLLFLVAFLGIFAQSAYAQKTLSDSILSGGIMRHYHIYIPKNYISGSARPLIIHLHGYSSNATIEQLFTNYMPVADTAGFLVVYPEGVKDNNGYQYWNAGIPGIPNNTPDDVAFISELIDSLHLRYHINRNQVYASGLSNGGYMCYQLAWKLSNKIAAIASVSGSMAPLEFAKCTPERPIPIMEIHGTADSVVHYLGSSIATNIDSLLRFWVLAGHCFPISDPIRLPDIDPNDGSNVTHFQWSAELLNISCELYRVDGGAHVDWPGAGNGNNMDFSASPTIWQFFNRFQLSQASVKEIALSSSFSFYPNPCSSVVHISSELPGTVTITDLVGRTLLISREKNIDVTGLISGYYQVSYESNGILRSGNLIKF